MASTTLFEWEGRESSRNHPKSADWYWALGIVAVAATLAAILFSNYLLALLIIVAAVALALHAAKQPPIHRFRVLEQGLVVGEELHPFDEMLSFAVLEDVAGELPPLLSIKTENWFAPHLEIPLEDVDVDAVYDYFLDRVDEGAHERGVVDAVAGWLGF